MKCGVWPVAPRPAALVQVQRVEGEAAVGEVIGELGVEEVVGVAVHRQHRVPRPGPPVAAAHQGGDEVALAVGVGPSGIVCCQ